MILLGTLRYELSPTTAPLNTDVLSRCFVGRVAHIDTKGLI